MRYSGGRNSGNPCLVAWSIIKHMLELFFEISNFPYEYLIQKWKKWAILLLFIIFSKYFVNSFFFDFTFTLWKLGCKIDMCSSSSSLSINLCSSGFWLHFLFSVSKIDTIETTSRRTKIFLEELEEEHTSVLQPIFHKSESKNWKKQIHKIFAKYDKKQE